MAISVSCMACGKAYRVPEDRAGRKVRCQCGEAIFVPTSEDDDWEAHESSEDDLLVSPSQRRMEAKPPVPTKLPARVKPPVPPKSPTRSTTESSSPERQSPDAHQKAEEQRSGARNFGLSMAGTGIALLVLPLFGVQLRRAGNLGPQGAMIVGGVLFAIGAISFASASLIRVKPARKRRVSRRSAAAHAADAIDDDPEADDA